MYCKICAKHNIKQEMVVSIIRNNVYKYFMYSCPTCKHNEISKRHIKHSERSTQTGIQTYLKVD